MVNRRPEDWSFIHRDVYPAYISWEEFVANQAQLADNALRYPHRSRGAPREGVALLVGLVVCAGCGRQVHVAYKPQPRYLCQALTKAYGGPACLHLDAASIDAAVVDVFFQAIQPAELDVLEEVLAEQRANQDRVAQQYADQVTRATYEARMAQRQYEAVDPDNRLVAAELERRWSWLCARWPRPARRPNGLRSSRPRPAWIRRSARSSRIWARTCPPSGAAGG
jgi:hypothetical protein